jgi:hypothetical protein
MDLRSIHHVKKQAPYVKQKVDHIFLTSLYFTNTYTAHRGLVESLKNRNHSGYLGIEEVKLNVSQRRDIKGCGVDYSGSG